MYVDQNVAGQNLFFCVLPPHSASRTAVSFCFPYKADYDSNIVFYKAKDNKVVSFARALTKCPSTESCCWIQHLVAMYY